MSFLRVQREANTPAHSLTALLEDVCRANLPACSQTALQENASGVNLPVSCPNSLLVLQGREPSRRAQWSNSCPIKADQSIQNKPTRRVPVNSEHFDSHCTHIDHFHTLSFCPVRTHQSHSTHPYSQPHTQFQTVTSYQSHSTHPYQDHA